MSRRGGLTLVEALIVFLVLSGLWWAFLPGVREGHGRSSRTRCANDLRQLALGALNYADDKRFFPHLGGSKALDGGMETPDTPRKMRLLVQLGYTEPQAFVCAASDDAERRADPPAPLPTWGWGGTTGSPDPTLLETTELSYGWTRRFMNSSARSTELLGADRASRKGDDLPRPPGLVGNHAGGSNVMQADGSVSWVAAADPLAAHLADVTSVSLPGRVLQPPALTVEPPVEAPGAVERAGPVLPSAKRLAWVFAPPCGLFALLLGGVLLGGLNRRGARAYRPGPCEADGPG